MGEQRGVLLVTLPAEAADRLDFLTSQFAIGQEQAVCAAVAVLSSLVEARDERALRFLAMVRDDHHRAVSSGLARKAG